VIARRDAAVVLAATVLALGRLAAQATDSVPTMRHLLAIDYVRVRPFHREYDMVVVSRDSTVSVGRRDVTFSEALVADSSMSWMLVESRTGVVGSTDSILFAPDLRPIRWRSVLGPATLDLAFAADSTSGVVRVGNASSHLALGIPPDVIVSSPAVEMLAALLPLGPKWSDSAATLSVDVTGGAVELSELAVAGSDSVTIAAGSLPRSCWVLTLKASRRESRYWVDRETGAIVRAQLALPSHVGTMLEYRIRPPSTSSAP
jgi:hypothetical protein